MANGCREDIDTALLKLYAEQDHDSLLDLLASDNACLLADSVPWLEKYHKCVNCQENHFNTKIFDFKLVVYWTYMASFDVCVCVV